MFSKYFGYLSYQYKEREKRCLETSNFHFVTWTILQAAFIPLEIHFTYGEIYQTFGFLSVMEYCFFFIYYTMEVSTMLIAQISSKIYNKKLLDILNQVIEIEKFLKNSTNMHFKRVQINIITWILTSVTAIFITSTVFVAISLKLTTLPSKIGRIILVFAIYSSHAVPILLFSTTLSAFTEILHGINNYLQENIVENTPAKSPLHSEDFSKFLSDISLRYQEIFKSVRDLRQIFGLIVLCVSGMTFSMIVCHVYAFTSVKYFNVSAFNLILINWLMLFGFFVVIFMVYAIAGESYGRTVSIDL